MKTCGQDPGRTEVAVPEVSRSGSEEGPLTPSSGVLGYRAPAGTSWAAGGIDEGIFTDGGGLPRCEYGRRLQLCGDPVPVLGHHQASLPCFDFNIGVPAVGAAKAGIRGDAA